MENIFIIFGLVLHPREHRETVSLGKEWIVWIKKNLELELQTLQIRSRDLNRYKNCTAKNKFWHLPNLVYIKTAFVSFINVGFSLTLYDYRPDFGYSLFIYKHTHMRKRSTLRQVMYVTNYEKANLVEWLSNLISVLK
jgi:hypothetical protein